MATIRDTKLLSKDPESLSNKTVCDTGGRLWPAAALRIGQSGDERRCFSGVAAMWCGWRSLRDTKLTQ